MTNLLFFYLLYSAHEDIERLEQAIVDQYMEDPKTHLEKLYNEHIVDKFLTRIADKSEYLSQLYEDKDGYVPGYVLLFTRKR